MSDLRFTKDHEYIRLEDDGIAIVGISSFAQEQLGDIVFVELPEPGKEVSRGDEAAVVESVKAASEVYAPVGGEITEVNQALNDDPALVNRAPEADGWFVKMKLKDASELEQLMDAEAYKKFVEDEG